MTHDDSVCAACGKDLQHCTCRCPVCGEYVNPVCYALYHFYQKQRAKGESQMYLVKIEITLTAPKLWALSGAITEVVKGLEKSSVENVEIQVSAERLERVGEGQEWEPF